MVAVTARTRAATLRSVSKDDIQLGRRLVNFLYQRQVPGSDHVLLDVRGGVVAVGGELPTRRAKWLCIECCRRVAGVIRIIDDVKVAPERVKSQEEVDRISDLGGHRRKRRRTFAYQAAHARAVEADQMKAPAAAHRCTASSGLFTAICVARIRTPSLASTPWQKRLLDRHGATLPQHHAGIADNSGLL